MAKKAKRKPAKRKTKPATKIVRIEGAGSPAFKRAMLHKIAGHVLAAHDKPKRRKHKAKPIKLSKELAAIRETVRNERQPALPINKIPNVEISAMLNGTFVVENKRTGKRVSTHKSYQAAFDARVKVLKSERAKFAHELTHGRPAFHSEDHD